MNNYKKLLMLSFLSGCGVHSEKEKESVLEETKAEVLVSSIDGLKYPIVRDVYVNSTGQVFFKTRDKIGFLNLLNQNEIHLLDIASPSVGNRNVFFEHDDKTMLFDYGKIYDINESKLTLVYTIDDSSITNGSHVFSFGNYFFASNGSGIQKYNLDDTSLKEIIKPSEEFIYFPESTIIHDEAIYSCLAIVGTSFGVQGEVPINDFEVAT